MRLGDITQWLRPWRLLRLGLLGGLGLALALVVANGYVAVVTGGQRYAAPEGVPAERVAIVFGAGVRGDRPSRILAERIAAAVRLYQLGRVDKLLMTGDNGSANYDEVSAMRRYAEAHGVPAADITLDYAGFRTYDSCYRARAIFGVTRAVLVTQAFHLPRAVYSCRALGVEAVGLGTPDWGRYPPALLLRYSLREALATANALVELHLTRPLPTFLGHFEGIA